MSGRFETRLTSAAARVLFARDQGRGGWPIEYEPHRVPGRVQSADLGRHQPRLLSPHGLECRLHFTTDSVEQGFTGLIRGDWDIGLTGFDNVVAYQEGQGEAPVDRAARSLRLHGRRQCVPRLVVREASGVTPTSTARHSRSTRSPPASPSCCARCWPQRPRRGRRQFRARRRRAAALGGVQGRQACGHRCCHPVRVDRAAARPPLAAKRQRDVLPRYQGLVGATRRVGRRDRRRRSSGFIRGFVARSPGCVTAPTRRRPCALLVADVRT